MVKAMRPEQAVVFLDERGFDANATNAVSILTLTRHDVSPSTKGLTIRYPFLRSARCTRRMYRVAVAGAEVNFSPMGLLSLFHSVAVSKEERMHQVG